VVVVRAECGRKHGGPISTTGVKKMRVSPEDYLKVIPPPPVVLVSTLHGDVKNVAPFGMNMPISFDPPLYAIGVGRTRDTYQNIVDAKEFVIALPGPELAEQIDITATSFPREVSEFEESGLTPVKSEVVGPFRVGECQSHLECKLEWVKQAGDHYIIVGRVVAADIDDSLYEDDLSRRVLNPIYNVVSGSYATKGPMLGEE